MNCSQIIPRLEVPSMGGQCRNFKLGATPRWQEVGKQAGDVPCLRSHISLLAPFSPRHISGLLLPRPQWQMFITLTPQLSAATVVQPSSLSSPLLGPELSGSPKFKGGLKTQLSPDRLNQGIFTAPSDTSTSGRVGRW